MPLLVWRAFASGIAGRFSLAVGLPFAAILLAAVPTHRVHAEPSDVADIGLAEDVDEDQAADESPEDEEGLEYARDLGTGVASYYGARFAGKLTASGEPFDPTALTAAHRSLPFGSRVLVTNERTGQSVIVRINDRGPFHRGRIIDLSRAAADEIGLVRRGKGMVSLSLLAD